MANKIYPKLGELATALVAEIKKHDCIDNAELEKLSAPLLAQMKAEGLAVHDGGFVEAQGAWEFDLIAVCYFIEGPCTGPDPSRWFNVYPNGTVDAF